jgi:DNA-binding SARP family transcriptional activator
MRRVRFQLRILGPLTVSQDGRGLQLPASRKARALLAYLASAPRGVPRRRLCALLWDSSSDSRGELRWYLSKLRGVIGAARLNSREDPVRLDLSDGSVDAREVQSAMHAGIGTLAPERVRQLLLLFKGDFLEGLDVERCPEFTAWLLAQRRRHHLWRLALLERLVDCARDGEVVGHLEKWLEIAPLDIRAHERLLGALARRGRVREGEEHLAESVKLFSAEGLDCAALRKAWYTPARTKTRVGFKSVSGTDVQAHDYYLQGRQHLARMMKHGLHASRDMFVRAIELDADCARAWAGLATVHACLVEWFDGGRVSLACAEQTSRRALAIAPQLAEAHVARGLARSLSRRYDEAVGEFEAALRIDPDLFDAYYYYGRTAFASGHMTRAAEMFGLAAQLRPQDFQSAILLGTTLSAVGRDGAAHDATRTGVRRAEQALVLDPRDGRALSLGAGALFDDGQTDRALEWSRQALELYPDDTSALVNVACLYARTNQVGAALDLLERVFARGCGKRDWVQNDPDYTSLRNEPRFQRLLENIR